METVAIVILSAAPAALAVVLAVRELKWRRTVEALLKQCDATDAQLRERDRLVQMGQVVSGLAQDLKNPLQGVIGNTELAIATQGTGDASQELREIQENATRAAGIVRNLLAFTETSALSRRWQDINELANRAVDGVRGELDASGVRVNFVLAERLPLMYVDGRQLEKVIMTLLSRPAPRSSPRREAAAVTLATRRGDPDDKLVIELDDHTAASENLDEPSWSGDLVACRQIIQAHGGSLEVERPANGGYRFHLELPVTAGGPEPLPLAIT